LSFGVWVAQPERDVWEANVVTKVFFLFSASPAIEVSCEYMVVVAVVVVGRVWCGGVKVGVEGGEEVLDLCSGYLVVWAEIDPRDVDGGDEFACFEGPCGCLV
jgi:hypothetical protein